MSHVLLVHIPERPVAKANLDLGLSSGRWAFSETAAAAGVPPMVEGDLLLFGLGGSPRGGGGFEGWQQRAFSEAHLARVTGGPFVNEEPFWIDERRDGVVRWNPSIEIEYVAELGALPLAAGRGLSREATNAFYRGAVAHQIHRVPASGCACLDGHASAGGTPSPAALTLVREPARRGGATRSGGGVRRGRAGDGEAVRRTRLVALEALRSRQMLVRARAATTADPVESQLLHAYADHLLARGDSLRRLAIPVEGDTIYSDLVSLERGALVEAKGRATRKHVREAIGQVFDYGRHWKSRLRAVLLPERPADDLLDLLRSVDVHAVWRVEDGFEDTARGALV